MASVARHSGDGRTGWRVRFYVQKRRREIYLPNVSKKIADTVARHCDELAGAIRTNTKPAPESSAWANSTEGSLRQSLVAWGLADPANERLGDDHGRYLGPFCVAYISGRSDVKQSTATNYGQTKRLLVEFFGERKPIRGITAADGERWKRWLLSREVQPATAEQPARTMAIASVSKHIKRAKTMFSEAVADRLINESPFGAVKAGSQANPARQRFIDLATSERILNFCPDADWRVIFALARFGGMRCPSEVLSLKWSDIDWHDRRIRIDSPKTGLRFCPLFPEMAGILSEALEIAADGSVYCVGRYHGAKSNLRTQLGRILQKAGLKPWPKLFNNLRASRRTELQEVFPSHVIDAWLGHSTKVAELHYLTVTDDHWQRAGECSPTGSPITDPASLPKQPSQNQKTHQNQVIDGLGWLLNANLVTPMGFEDCHPNQWNSILSSVGSPQVPPSEAIRLALALEWFSRLPSELQDRCIEHIRAMALSPLPT